MSKKEQPTQAGGGGNETPPGSDALSDSLLDEMLKDFERRNPEPQSPQEDSPRGERISVDMSATLGALSPDQTFSNNPSGGESEPKVADTAKPTRQRRGRGSSSAGSAIVNPQGGRGRRKIAKSIGRRMTNSAQPKTGTDGSPDEPRSDDTDQGSASGDILVPPEPDIVSGSDSTDPVLAIATPDNPSSVSAANPPVMPVGDTGMTATREGWKKSYAKKPDTTSGAAPTVIPHSTPGSPSGSTPVVSLASEPTIPQPDRNAPESEGGITVGEVYVGNYTKRGKGRGKLELEVLGFEMKGTQRHVRVQRRITQGKDTVETTTTYNLANFPGYLEKHGLTLRVDRPDPSSLLMGGEEGIDHRGEGSRAELRPGMMWRKDASGGADPFVDEIQIAVLDISPDGQNITVRKSSYMSGQQNPTVEMVVNYSREDLQTELADFTLVEGGEARDRRGDPYAELHPGMVWEGKLQATGSLPEAKIQLRIIEIGDDGVATIQERHQYSDNPKWEVDEPRHVLIEMLRRDLRGYTYLGVAGGVLSQSEPLGVDIDLNQLEVDSERDVPGERGESPERAPHRIDLRERIKQLQAAVDKTREEFINFEETQKRSTGRLRNILRFFQDQRRQELDEHVQREIGEYRSQYDEAITGLLEAKLEQLKHSKLSKEDLRSAMAALIYEFRFEEGERLYETRKKFQLAEKSESFKEKRQRHRESLETFLEENPGKLDRFDVMIYKFIGNVAIAGEKGLDTYQKLGDWNRKIMKGKAGKYILTATLAGTGAVALGGLTGGAATLAVGALALRRFAGGAGAADVAEGGMNWVAKKLRQVRARDGGNSRRFMGSDEVRKTLDAVQGIEEGEDKEVTSGGGEIPPDFSHLEEFLKEEIVGKAHDRDARRRRNELYRKAGAITLGMVVGSGVLGKIFSHIGGRNAVAAVVDKSAGGNGAVVSPGALSPDAAASAAANPASSAASVAAVEHSASAPGGGAIDTRPVAGTPRLPGDGILRDISGGRRYDIDPGVKSSSISRSLLESHRVEQGESIWKMAEKSVSGITGMDERATVRFAKLVELKLQEKLAHIDPDVAQAAGFTANAQGEFTPHFIRAGADLNLGKLLTSEEIARMMEEAKGNGHIIAAAQHAVDHSAVSGGTTSGGVAGDALRDSRPKLSNLDKGLPRDIPGGRRYDIDPGAVSRAIDTVQTPEVIVDALSPQGVVMDHIQTLSRDDQLRLLRQMKKLTLELFQTNDLTRGEIVNMQYDPAQHPEFSTLNLKTILVDQKMLSEHPFTSYDRLKDPLHYSQMEEIARFAEATKKAFGVGLAEPKPTENVQHYVLRMVALAARAGKKIPGFRMVD